MAFASAAAAPWALRSAAAFRSSTAGDSLGRGGAGCQDWTAAAPQYLVGNLSTNQASPTPSVSKTNIKVAMANFQHQVIRHAASWRLWARQRKAIHREWAVRFLRSLQRRTDTFLAAFRTLLGRNDCKILQVSNLATSVFASV